MLGRSISHYQITEKLGEGGMGVVYKALDTKLDRFVALKFLQTALPATTEDTVRFFHEAKAASSVDHPNICTVYDFDETPEGQTFIVMAYYEGMTLKQKLAGGPLQPAEAVTIGLGIADGLEAAHQKGIVHRDIKSSNILLTSSGQVKIMDFGLAKLRGHQQLTNKGTALGTVAYMSPEQARGDEVDNRTDIWSFGVVLYEMLTGVLPFRSEYDQAMIYSILNEEPRPVSEFATAPGDRLSRIVARALAKDPDKRYARIAELRADLAGSASDAGGATGQEATSRKTLAVLPFENIGADRGDEYFSDGLTEETITTLSQIKSLRVISRSSVMRYRGTTLGTRQVASELGVRYLLEGSVRRQGDLVRITSQLIDAVGDTHIWAEKFSGTMKDIFAIQERVAGEIAGALKVHFSDDTLGEMRKRAAASSEAYENYLRGRYHWNRRSEESLRTGIRFFKKAIEIDPVYALAHTGLADSYNILGYWNMMPPKEAFTLSVAAAKKALELNDRLVEGHTSLAYGYLYTWRWEDAERSFRRAIETDPGYAVAHQWYGNFLLVRNRLDEARREFRKARELDPLSLIINTADTWVDHITGNDEDAIRSLRKTLELDADFVPALEFIGRAYESVGRFDEAIEAFGKAHSLEPTPGNHANLAHAYAVAGQTAKAEEILGELLHPSTDKYIAPYSIAEVYVGLGRTDEAFTWLSAAVRAGSRGAAFLIVEPRLKPLHSDPRYAKLLESIEG
jgi:serine/threonine protein kinase/Tfp pilus assembly protein PilF